MVFSLPPTAVVATKIKSKNYEKTVVTKNMAGKNMQGLDTSSENGKDGLRKARLKCKKKTLNTIN